MNAIVQSLNQGIYVISSPVCNIGELMSSVFIKGIGIRQRSIFRIRVGIEIIVKVYSIDIIITNHIHYDLDNIFLHLRYTRIKELFTLVSEEPFRFQAGNMLSVGIR